MNTQKTNRLLRPIEIIESFPEIAEVFDCMQIGHLLEMKLIKGKKLHRGSVIEVDSLRKVIEFKKSIEVKIK